MKKIADRSHHIANKSAANRHGSSRSNSKPAFQWSDKRPVAAQLAKLQQMANDYTARHQSISVPSHAAADKPAIDMKSKLEPKTPTAPTTQTGSVIQTYPPINLGEGQWCDTDTGEYYFEEADACRGYIKWAEEQLQSGKDREIEDNLERAKERLAAISAENETNEQEVKGQQEDVQTKEPTNWRAMQVAGQEILLIGTTHGMAGEDLSADVPNEVLANATVILEYPPLLMSGRKTYNAKDIKSINDKTQAALAERGTNIEGTLVIGADGRKAYVSKQAQGVSLRYKTPEEFKVAGDLIDKELILTLATTYMTGALLEEQSTIGGFVVELGKLVAFNTTDFIAVLATTSGHLRALATRIDTQERVAICNKVFQYFKLDVAKWFAYYDENRDERLIEYVNISLLNALFDAVCNLMLFTLVVVNKDRPLIVAFGNEHIKPLEELLEEVHKMRK